MLMDNETGFSLLELAICMLLLALAALALVDLQINAIKRLTQSIDWHHQWQDLASWSPEDISSPECPLVEAPSGLRFLKCSKSNNTEVTGDFLIN